MKVLKIAVLPLVALALSLGSCQKSAELDKPVKKGGDLDRPVLLGSIRTSQQVAVPYGLVEAYHHTSNELDTTVNADSHGDYILTLSEAGTYYFKAYDGLTLLTTTESMDISDTVYFDIVQE